jgi:hypothetical protein
MRFPWDHSRDRIGRGDLGRCHRSCQKCPCSRESRTMHSSHPASLNELAVLMELRLAFGPGTRLWANSSREDLCYEWLHYKGRRSAANLRDFAKGLLARECADFADRKALCDIRRRVAIVLKAYHLKRTRQSIPTAPAAPRMRPGRAGSAHGYPACGEVPGNLDLLIVTQQFPLKQNEVPH